MPENDKIKVDGQNLSVIHTLFFTLMRKRNFRNRCNY